MILILLVAIVGKLVGCGLAALGSGMDWVRSLRVGAGMMSRGEVGLIVTAMGASTGIFGRTEVAVMVAVVLLTTLLTPIALRGAFRLKSVQDFGEGLLSPDTEATEPKQAIDPMRRLDKEPEQDSSAEGPVLAVDL
jgi:Kef-type K+ transport system membrane component KefB